MQVFVDFEDVFPEEGFTAGDSDHHAFWFEIFGELVDDVEPFLCGEFAGTFVECAVTAAIAAADVASSRDFEKEVSKFVFVAIALCAKIMSFPHHRTINHQS